MKFFRKAGCAGFSLVESMVGAMILGVVLVSVLTLASKAFVYLSDTRSRARSSQVLQQRMEDIRLLNWTQLQALPADFRDPADTNGLFTGQIVQTARESYDGTTTMLEVTALVTWTNRAGLLQTNSLTTLVSNGGLNKYIF